LENALLVKERELERLQRQIQESSDSAARVGLIEKVQNVLDNYLTRLTKIKVETLCKGVTQCFNQLSRKGGLLHDISINPKTFEVNLRDSSGYVISREELSAGEKQILAIAILWGLAKTSGRPLPVIIDTPLGRLDSEHRMNLVKNYFPRAGHQVILLSTDTEVDQKLFHELRPYVSHCFHLIYDKTERKTFSRQEYFWREPSDA
jgi:DNA sulfur modification protein DndD